MYTAAGGLVLIMLHLGTSIIADCDSAVMELVLSVVLFYQKLLHYITISVQDLATSIRTKRCHYVHCPINGSEIPAGPPGSSEPLKGQSSHWKDRAHGDMSLCM